MKRPVAIFCALCLLIALLALPGRPDQVSAVTVATFSEVVLVAGETVTVTYHGTGSPTYYHWLSLPPENYVDGVLTGEWWTKSLSPTVGYGDTITIPESEVGKYIYVQIWDSAYAELQNSGVPMVVLAERPATASFNKPKAVVGESIQVLYTGLGGVPAYYHWLSLPPENYVDGVLTGEWWTKSLSPTVGYGDTITIPESELGNYLMVQVWDSAYTELQRSDVLLIEEAPPLYATFNKARFRANDTVTVQYNGTGTPTYYHWLSLPPENYVDGVLTGEWWTKSLSPTVGYGDTITIPESEVGNFIYVQVWDSAYNELQNSGTPILVEEAEGPIPPPPAEKLKFFSFDEIQDGLYLGDPVNDLGPTGYRPSRPNTPWNPSETSWVLLGWGGVHDVYFLTAEAGKGASGKAARVELARMNSGNSVNWQMYFNASLAEPEVTNWVGAEEVMFYLDLSQIQGGDWLNFIIQFGELACDAEGNILVDTNGNVTSRIWTPTDAPNTYILEDGNGGWYNLPAISNYMGYVAMPMGYKGWVRMPTSTFRCTSDPNLEFNPQFMYSIILYPSIPYQEGTEISRDNPQILYLDDFTIAGSDLYALDHPEPDIEIDLEEAMYVDPEESDITFDFEGRKITIHRAGMTINELFEVMDLFGGLTAKLFSAGQEVTDWSLPIQNGMVMKVYDGYGEVAEFDLVVPGQNPATADGAILIPQLLAGLSFLAAMGLKRRRM